MVDGVEPAAVGGQQMAALAVAVVDDGVQHGQTPQPLVVGVYQKGRTSFADLGETHRFPAGPRLLPLDQRQQLRALGRRLDPLLDHALPVRAVAQHGGGDQVPAGGPGQLVRGDLTLGERAVGEVPQRALAGDGLVDAGAADVPVGDRAVQDGVGRLADLSAYGQLAVGEGLGGQLSRAGRGAGGYAAGRAAVPAAVRPAAPVAVRLPVRAAVRAATLAAPRAATPAVTRTAARRPARCRLAGRSAARRHRLLPRHHASRRYPFWRGHTCPSGSSGRLHSGHGGRPALTTSRARLAKDRAIVPVTVSYTHL